jgi:cyclase
MTHHALAKEDRHEMQEPSTEPGRVVPVAAGTYAYPQPDGTWWINSCGFVVGPAGVVVIDSCATARRTAALRAAVRETSGDLPVTTVVNTHAHGDHTYGNQLFAGAAIIGHHRCRTTMLADTLREDAPGWWEPTPDWGPLEITPPTITFSDRLDVWAGDLLVELHHIGPRAHTDGDVVAWLPDRDVLFAGDLVSNGVTPLLLFGSVTGYLEALDRVRSFPADVLVPGHGVPCGPEILDGLERYARFVLATARAGLATDRTPLECARTAELGEFRDLGDNERLVLNLHRAYADLSGGADVDVAAAFSDAVRWLGRPMRCSA